MSFLRRVGPVPAIFLGFWLLLMVGGRSRLFRDPGTFWHTRTGELILEHGFFDADPFMGAHGYVLCPERCDDCRGPLRSAA